MGNDRGRSFLFTFVLVDIEIGYEHSRLKKNIILFINKVYPYPFALYLLRIYTDS